VCHCPALPWPPPQGITWSTDQVLAQTVERAEAAGLSVAPLGTLPVLQVGRRAALGTTHGQPQAQGTVQCSHS